LAGIWLVLSFGMWVYMLSTEPGRESLNRRVLYISRIQLDVTIILLSRFS